MKRLAVIPSDPLAEYKRIGYGGFLKDYYNPSGFFDEVFALSPLEKKEHSEFGMKIIPTKDKQLKKHLKECRAGIVRAYGGNWPADMACRFKVKSVPVIISVHDRREEWLHDSVRDADYVICVTEDVKDLVLSKGVEKTRITVIPNKINTDVMRPVDAKELTDLETLYPFAKRILTVGRKSPEKNLVNLIHTLKKLDEDHCLIAIGRGDAAPYRDLAEKIGVGSRVFFLESVRQEELPRYYSLADCLCNPSLSEAMSFALLEAMACGCRVVTSQIAAKGIGLQDGDNGFLIEDPGDIGQIAAKISECLNHNDRGRLQENALKTIDRYKKPTVEKMEVEFYQRVLSESGQL